MRTLQITSGQNVYAQQFDALRADARGASFLLAQQMLSYFSLPTNPSNTQTLTLDINGTNVIFTFVTSIGSTAGNVLIGASAAATVANLLALLQQPQTTTATGVALSSANQQLLSYLTYVAPNSGTTLYVMSNNSKLYAPLTSFSASTTVTSGTWTSQTMQLYVHAGTVYVNGTRILWTGGSTPTVTAPVSHPRIDVLAINSSGTLAWTTGTEASTPSAPTYPADQVAICELYNVVSETALYDGENQQSSQGYIYNDVRPVLGERMNWTAFASNFIPDADGTRNLGSSGTEWNNVYAKSGIYVGGVGVAISKFGGNGSDGSLSISSGTTTIAVSSATFFKKNYYAVSITGTATLTISGQPAGGTILALLSQTGVTLTSTATALIDLSSKGQSSTSVVPTASFMPPPTNAGSGSANGGTGASTAGLGGVAGYGAIDAITQIGHTIPLTCGGAGGTGSSAYNGSFVYGGGAGGGGGMVLALYSSLTANTGTLVVAGGAGAQGGITSSSMVTAGVGGGALYIECGGAFNFTGTISVAGQAAPYGAGSTGGAGGNGTGGSGTGGPGAAPSYEAGGGGGSGGIGGANGGAAGGSGGGGGASGSYYIGQNTSFS